MALHSWIPKVPEEILHSLLQPYAENTREYPKNSLLLMWLIALLLFVQCLFCMFSLVYICSRSYKAIYIGTLHVRSSPEEIHYQKCSSIPGTAVIHDMQWPKTTRLLMGTSLPHPTCLTLPPQKKDKEMTNYGAITFWGPPSVVVAVVGGVLHCSHFHYCKNNIDLLYIFMV